MESDSSLSTIALVLSVAVFSLATLVNGSLYFLGREGARQLVTRKVPGAPMLLGLYSPARGTTTALTAIKFLAMAAAILSLTALVDGTLGSHWGYVAGLAAALIFTLGALHAFLRALGRHFAETIAPWSAPFLMALTWGFKPFLILQGVAHKALPVGGRNGEANGTEFTEGATPVESPLASLDKPLDEREAKMIRAILDLEETSVREIMVPRVDIISAETSDSLADVANLMAEQGVSRIPVYEENIDNIVGIAYARDILRLLNQRDQAPSLPDLKKVVRPAHFVPESKGGSELLREMQAKHIHIAIVVDEYGGTAGLATIEDLLEEIVGEIEDEFEVGEPQIERLDGNEAIMDARVTLDDINDLFSLSLKGEGFDTIGGVVYHQLGKIPSESDEVDYQGLRIRVLSTLGRRIKKVRVVKTNLDGESPN